MRDWMGMLQRGIRKPPRVILERLTTEARAEWGRFFAPQRRRIKITELLTELRAHDASSLWQFLAQRPYPACVQAIDSASYDSYCPGSLTRILRAADRALEHRVDMLGSGPVDLGNKIAWSRDFKSGFSWPERYFRDIEYGNLTQPSDVKIAWELSRMQWLIPLGQAYLLTGGEHYAEAVRSVLTQWIDANPYASTVNWSCTMEVALRIITWTWFFHVFHNAPAWQDLIFQEKFLCALYLHVEFTEKYIERSDINGNHYTADAAGLLFGGLFFGQGANAKRWQQQGWSYLSYEIQRQIYPDGVDFEGSTAYHRLVMELFLLPALYRLQAGMPVEATYREKLLAMGKFTAAYTKPNGNAPLWGDADDARTLPFGGQDINDHRYLIGMASIGLQDRELLASFSGQCEEIFWWFGADACMQLPKISTPPSSADFTSGGFYIMRGEIDHVFIDCGPMGLAGRGGHGHNDCLAFEAVLAGQPLISDCGAYLYTASMHERNAFRSTSYHNTPQIDGAEINRFIRPDYLWSLQEDAIPLLRQWQVKDDYIIFQGEHHGYKRLEEPVIPQRTILLSVAEHAMYVRDNFIGNGLHDVRIPIHLAPGVAIRTIASDALIIEQGGQRFRIWWLTDAGYTVSIEDARVSPSYGVTLQAQQIIWRRENNSLRSLSIFIAPEKNASIFESSLLHRLSSK